MNRKNQRLKCAVAVLMAAVFCGLYPVAAWALSPMTKVAAQSAVLMDLDTGQILFEKNMDERQYPASITKIMTALLAFENAELNDVVTMSDEAVFSVPRDTSHIALDEGEQIPLLDALYAMLLPSANDAANGIAEHVGGSLAGFADLMNSRAAELGAQNTHFTNANGLPDSDHYTTARDMALITREALTHPELTEIWGTEKKTIPATNKNVERHLWNQVELVLDTGRHYDDCTGGKLGWTQESQHTLVAVAERNGRRLLCVLLQGEQLKRNSTDAITLFDYGFDHITPVTVPGVLLNPPSLPVYQDDVKKGDLYFGGEDYNVLLDDSLIAADVEISYTLPDELEYGTPFACLATYRVKGTSGQYAELGSQTLYVVREELAPVTAKPKEQKPLEIKAMLLAAGKYLLITVGILVVLGVLFVAAVLLRRKIVLSQRRKRRMQQRKGDPAPNGTPRPNAASKPAPSPRRPVPTVPPGAPTAPLPQNAAAPPARTRPRRPADRPASSPHSPKRPPHRDG